MSMKLERSWIAAANQPNCNFPLANLPFCAFTASGGEQHLGVGIGDQILDMFEAANAGLFDSVSDEIRTACGEPVLNRLMALGREASSQLRRLLMSLLTEETDGELQGTVHAMLRPITEARFAKPVAIGNYTDFYASIHHAMNVGRLFRPDQPLLPNYKFVPIGYHGRASSIVVSGTPVKRPCGQRKAADVPVPEFGPSRQLDYELELGVYVGRGNELGEPIDIADAERHMFGICMVNDWSARDIQAWEYQPLGPFLGKSFATAVSPWVVTMDALEPFRVPLAPRGEGDPEPLPYLACGGGASGVDVQLEVCVSSRTMRDAGLEPIRVSSSNARELYWSFAQMIAHHTSNGCNLLTGDLLASGTISGAEEGAQGSLLEVTRRGLKPLRLPSGEERMFLEDGDEVTLRGFCQRDGGVRIGLGECKGMVIPASLSSRMTAATR